MEEIMEDIIFRRLILPIGRNRLGARIVPRYITIHETITGIELDKKEKDVYFYIKQIHEQSKTVSYHYLVSDKFVIQFIPDDELAFHCKVGNDRSIGIERVVNEGTDFVKAINIQAMLAATLMSKWGINISNVVPHKHWTGKECPGRLLAGLYGGWDEFIRNVNSNYLQHDFIDAVFYY